MRGLASQKKQRPGWPQGRRKVRNKCASVTVGEVLERMVSLLGKGSCKVSMDMGVGEGRKGVVVSEGGGEVLLLQSLVDALHIMPWLFPWRESKISAVWTPYVCVCFS